MTAKIFARFFVGAVLCSTAVVAADTPHINQSMVGPVTDMGSTTSPSACAGFSAGTLTTSENCVNGVPRYKQLNSSGRLIQPGRAKIRLFGTGGTGYELLPPAGGVISSATGAFSQVQNLYAIADLADPINGYSGHGPNSYSVQLNTNQAAITDAVLCPSGCYAWLQTVFINGEAAIAAGSQGSFWMQLWLFSKTGTLTCPSGWIQKNSSACQLNTAMVSVPIVPVSEFANLQINTSISGGLITATTPDVMNMAKNWTLADFNVYGHGQGSSVFFNAGASITVNLTATYSGNGPVTCSRKSIVAESNNLKATACTVLSGGNGIQYTESPF